MKKIILGILTIFITILIFVFSIVSNLEKTVMNTVDNILAEELTNTLVDVVQKNSNISKETIEKKMAKVLEETEGVENIINSYIEKIIDMAKGKEIEEINVTKEIESILTQSESILKEYDITITEEQKKELFAKIEEYNINKELNDSLKELQNAIPSEVKTSLEIYEFVRSTTFKMILIGGILLFLIFIAFLKKSYYKWLTNLGFSLIANGLLLVLGVSFTWEYIKSMTTKIEYFSFKDFTNFGYSLLGLGCLCILIYIVVSIILKKKKEKTISTTE